MKGLRKMKELIFLLVHPGFWSYYDKVSQYFPNTIGYVHWSSYPFSYLPKTFEGNNLVTLRMATSNIVQLWEEGERKVELLLNDLVLHHYISTHSLLHYDSTHIQCFVITPIFIFFF